MYEDCDEEEEEEEEEGRRWRNMGKKLGSGSAQLDIVDMHDRTVVFLEKRSNGLN